MIGNFDAMNYLFMKMTKSTEWASFIKIKSGKSCESSSSGKFKALQCPQNSAIRDNGWTDLFVLNVGVVWWNPQILMAYPQSIVFNPQFSILNASFSILLPQISFLQP